MYELWSRWKGEDCPVRIGRAVLKEPRDCDQTGELVVLPEEGPEDLSQPEQISLSKDLYPGEERTKEQMGTFKFSDPAANRNGDGKASLRVYPNPASLGSMLTIEYFAKQTGRPLRIMDATGRLLREIDADLIIAGWNKLDIAADFVSSGTYIVVDGYGNYNVFVIIE